MIESWAAVIFALLALFLGLGWFCTWLRVLELKREIDYLMGAEQTEPEDEDYPI